ncbi:MAG: hypothetical protein ABH886_04675 [Candidatus Desantisbacteria bacterium]
MTKIVIIIDKILSWICGCVNKKIVKAAILIIESIDGQGLLCL